MMNKATAFQAGWAEWEIFRRIVEFSGLNGGRFERGFYQLRSQRRPSGASSAKLPTPAPFSAPQ